MASWGTSWLIICSYKPAVWIFLYSHFIFCFLQRLFFLNGEQDLSAFLLVDLGIVKYPTYNCILSDQIFGNRSDLLSYEEVCCTTEQSILFLFFLFFNFLFCLICNMATNLLSQAIEVAQIMDESLDENNSELVSRCIEVSDFHISNSLKTIQSSTSGSTDAFLSCFSASWVHSKVVLLGVSFLEREQRYGDSSYWLLSVWISNYSSFFVSDYLCLVNVAGERETTKWKQYLWCVFFFFFSVITIRYNFVNILRQVNVWFWCIREVTILGESTRKNC